MSRALIARPVAGIQVNHCKTVGCGQFGVAPLGSRKWDRSGYRFFESALNPLLTCQTCKRSTALKSNQGIAEEIERLKRPYLEAAPSCPNVECVHHGRGISESGLYHRFGLTSRGSQRYRCRVCRSTFAVRRKATHRQRRAELNAAIFRKLVNKAPMRRLCEELEISAAVLYNKIGFIHRQCTLYASAVEARLDGGKGIRRLYLSTDRQDYIFNWGSHLDRTNVTLHAIGTADNASGYVFGMHLDFDPEMDSEIVEKLARAAGDLDVPIHRRRYARLWLPSDYDSDLMLKRRLKRHRSRGTDTLQKAQEYQAELARRKAGLPPEAEVAEVEPDGKRPPVGMQVRSDYTLYAHFFFLRDLIGGAGKLRFFLDMEPSILAAVVSAFRERFTAKEADAFYVKIRKDMTIQRKKTAVSTALQPLADYIAKHPEMSRPQARHALLKEQLEAQFPHGQFGGGWIRHPYPHMGEPEKQVYYCTDTGAYGADHFAYLLLRASLHSIDKFFMLVRRRLNIFERPIHTPSSASRSWYGYQGYNPAVGAKLLEIFRVFYNYVKVGDDGRTPAMRLGLIERAASYAEVLDFMPATLAGGTAAPRARQD